MVLGDTVVLYSGGSSKRVVELVDVLWEQGRGKPRRAIIRWGMAGRYDVSLKDGHLVGRKVKQWHVDEATLKELIKLTKRMASEARERLKANSRTKDT